MSYVSLVATSAFGLESIVAYELKALGYSDLKVENGKVTFKGDYSDIAACNIRLRCANRIFLELASFSATDFEELFQGVKSVKWEEMLPLDAFLLVTARSVKSKLFSKRDIQSISKKAIIESLKRKYNRKEFPESGDTYHIEVAILKDKVTLLLNASGDGLHKRGYRTETGSAPLRETLAAALISISRWKSDRILADPFCGSGTIPIEAALVGINRAPGINRSFAGELWPFIPQKIWENEREKAKAEEIKADFKIFASDSDYHVFARARANAQAAGVEHLIDFQKRPLSEFSSKHKYGCLIGNPPYGQRIGADSDLFQLYKELGEIYKLLDSWSFFILTGFENFESAFGQKSDKNRKLYNGKLKTYLYQYMGPLPPRRKE
jgi:putative N6-adenine-specific DNA methylase